MSARVIQLLDPEPPEAFSGWWEAAAAEEAVAFDLAAAPEPEVVVYRASVPADAGEAARRLQRRERELAGMEPGLDAAETRLERFVQAARSMPAAGAEQAFALDAPRVALPEAELGAVLGPLVQEEQAFALEGRVGSMDEARRQVEAWAEQIRKWLLPYYVVETVRGEVLVARTVVDMDGDFRTVVRAECEREDAGLHALTMRNALAARRAETRVLLLVLSAVSKLGLLVSTPWGWMQLPGAIVRFVRQVLEEVRQRAPHRS